MKTLIKSTSLNTITTDWLKDFSKQRNEPSWLLDLRLKAFDQYNSLPWPDLRDEKWKRTELNLLSFDKLQFIPTREVKKEDGWITLDQALKSKPEEIRESWTLSVERAKANKFFSLTLALGNGGSCYFGTEGTKTPTLSHYYFPEGTSGAAQFPLNFIFTAAGSQSQIWEEMRNENPAGEDLAFISSFTSLHLRENSSCSLYSVQQWNNQTLHFQFQNITQEKDSRMVTIAVQMGGRVFRNEMTIQLNGLGAENKVLGILFGDEDQNFENWLNQIHTGRKTISDIQYRGALKGKAHSFFSGLVSITKEAQQSDAFQSCKSLLLSKDARADAIPNLEILADDVKCAHGAAVGPVDEDQKYYLQSRGVPPEKAEEIIVEGFFEPVIAELPSEEAQEKLRSFLEKKLTSA